jgi:hypothetical protein
MPSTGTEVEPADTEAEAPADPGVPHDAPGPYDGVEPDKTTGGFFWWNDPLYPGNDVEANAEWKAGVEAAAARLRGEEVEEPEDELADA